jgi:uncharacterized membrane protein YfcA
MPGGGEIALLLGVGVAAGFINAVAGGGSVLTLPALEWATGSALIANGTNRIAIILQNVAAIAGFGDKLDRREAVKLTIPAVFGGVLGAWVATMLSADSMRVALSVTIALVAATAVFKPPRAPRLKTWQVPAGLFVAGFYAGFVQAGVGFLLLAVLAGGLAMDLVRANATKVFIVLFTAVPALIIFAMKGQVRWVPGLITAVGSMSGAWIASRLAVKKGAAWTRWVVAGAAMLAIGKLLIFPSG